MNTLTKSLLPLTLLAAPAHAGIDSGGGSSVGGATVNHSSIGEPFTTQPTTGGPTRNQPGLVEVLYPITPASITDVDANGLPDGWEIGNFGALGTDPNADPDHDGTTNRMEYLAGTDPNKGTSVFRPQGSYQNAMFHLPITTVTGRNYRIWVTRDLKEWTHHATLIGNGETQIYQFDETTVPDGPLHSPTHPSAYYFRVEILIP